jgi:hypothetical protein
MVRMLSSHAREAGGDLSLGEDGHGSGNCDADDELLLRF